jgi:hypothetical protein
MFQDSEGPIQRFEWGRFTIKGKLHTEHGDGVGKDIRLIGDEVTGWAEREGHLLNREMITGVYNEGIEMLIIGNGVNEKLECPDDVKDSIRRHGIAELQVLSTPLAYQQYNLLTRQGRKVALLAHGTC